MAVRPEPTQRRGVPEIRTVLTEHSHGQSSYGHASDQFSNLKNKATEQFSKVADQTEGVATRLAEHGREAGERMQQV